jgi:flagellin-specific chaperone FliS
LFEFVLRNLVKADLQRDPILVADSLRILHLHRETWLAVAERLKQKSAAEASVAVAGQFSWSS